jgi:hypothetical protein
VNAGETIVRRVLQVETQFVVPLYQRRHSWEHDKDKDPLDQLRNDLLVVLLGTRRRPPALVPGAIHDRAGRGLDGGSYQHQERAAGHPAVGREADVASAIH